MTIYSDVALTLSPCLVRDDSKLSLVRVIPLM